MKRIFAALLLLALPLCGAGCAPQAAQSALQTQGPAEVLVLDGEAAQGGEAAAAATVVGMVESIVGNEVVLSLGTTASGGAGGVAQEEAPAGDGAQKEAATGGEPPAGGRMPESIDLPAQGELTAVGQTAGGRSGGGRTGGTGSTAGDTGRVDITYTGEAATYLLPVGMAIGTGDFSSVTEGMVLRLSLDAEGTITAVSILSR